MNQQLPEPVLERLHHVLIEDRHPAFLITDRSGVLVEKGGSLAIYGLENLQIGETVSTQAVFMAGLLPLEWQEFSLPCIAVAPQVFADIHCFRAEDRDYLLLVDVTSSEARQGLLQQKANDLNLLRNHHTNLTELLCDLDMAFLRQKDDRHFYPVCKPPEWIEHCGLQFIPEENIYRVASTAGFLYNFVSLEENGEQQDHRLKSGPWIETDPQGADWYFEATIVSKGKEKILMIERLAPYDEPRFAILQKAREQSLEYLSLAKKEKLLREKDSRNRILLNAVPDWIFKINRVGIILDLKASMGKNPLMFAEFLRKPLSDIFPEEAAEAMIRCTEKALRSRTLETCSFPLGPSSAPVPFEARVVAIGDQEAVLLVREM